MPCVRARCDEKGLTRLYKISDIVGAEVESFQMNIKPHVQSISSSLAKMRPRMEKSCPVSDSAVSDAQLY